MPPQMMLSMSMFLKPNNGTEVPAPFTYAGHSSSKSSLS